MKLGTWIDKFNSQDPVIVHSLTEKWSIEYENKDVIAKSFRRTGEVKEFLFDNDKKLNVFINT